MLIINVEEVQPGMRLAAPVAHPDNPQQDLLKAGYCIEESILPALRDLGVTWLYVDYPGLEDLDRHLAPQLSPGRQKMYHQIRTAMTQAQCRMSAGVSYADYYATTREMISTLLLQGAHPFYLERVSGIGPDAVAHATTVAHLSLLLALRMEAYVVQQRSRLSPQHAREVVNLGVAGMLHDIGKMKLPESLRQRCEFNAPRRDTSAAADARREWESHPRVGYNMIRKGVESSAAAAVLHHHQHFDGTGFPTPKMEPALGKRPPVVVPPPQGQQIHIFARILFVADMYANLAHPPISRIRRGNLEVLHLMRTRFARWLDPVVFRTLQAVAPPFLPGSKVMLGDHTTAAVVAVRPNDPYVPIVRRFKPNGAELDGPELDLRQSGSPRVYALAGGMPVADYLPAHGRNCAVAC